MNQTTSVWGANSDDEDDLDTGSSMWGGRKAYIFLIDASESMFEEGIEYSRYFTICIQACKQLMLNKIYHQEKDLFGIILYGTKHVGQAAQPNHVTTLQSLDESNADKIKELMSIEEDVDEFEKTHGHSADFSLAEALWHCQKMISDCKTRIYQKYIYLMTCNDDPHSKDPKLQEQTRKRVDDLKQLDFKLEILPFGNTFNFDQFFKEIYDKTHYDGQDNTDTPAIKPIKEVADILNFVVPSFNNRSLSRVLWTLNGDIQIGVAVFNFVKSAAPFPKKVHVDRKKNALLTSYVQEFNVDSGEKVSRAEISKTLAIGGKNVTFEREELTKIKRISQRGLILLGFKPIYTVKIWFHKKAPSFLYPEERLVKGSRTLFAALHERCLLRKVAPICYFTSRNNARPALVALIPQAEKLDEDNTQLMPPGFVLRYLPYADDIRDLQEQQVVLPHPEPELVNVAEKIVNKLRIDYKPSSFDNPKLQKHWAGIEALALGYEEPNETVDVTLPDVEGMDERVGHLANDFMEMAFPGGFDESVIRKSVKRSGASTSQAPKKAKPDLNNTTMDEIARQGQVEQLTNDKLKEYLANENIKTTKMKKAQLVEAVYHHLGINQP